MSKAKILEFRHDVFIFSNNKQRHYFNQQTHTKLGIEVETIISIYNFYRVFIGAFSCTCIVHLDNETHENSKDCFPS